MTFAAIFYFTSMSVFRLSLFIVFLLLAGPRVFGQTAQDTTKKAGSIKGKLTDGQNQPIAYATVTLLRTDSSVVNGDLSGDDGSFKISPTGMGTFRLRIQALGMATKTIDVTITSDAPDKNVGKIKIAATENMLKEEVITGEKPIVEMHPDKKVFNVEKNTTTAGGSAADVLQNVPAVSVDADGNVSLRGKSDVTILIDGKPATLLGSDVASALETMPAGSIESVEVITSPGAKYDAQGSTGIINIVTKKDGRLGMNGTATLGVGTHDKYNGNLGLNVKKGKWNAFLNSSFRLHPNWNNITTDRYNKTLTETPHDTTYQNYRTLENAPRSFNGSFNSIGASFDPDKYNSITLTQNINIMAFQFDDYSNYTVYNTAAPVTTIGGTPSLVEDRNTTQAGGPVSLSTALDYKHKFKKKDEELSFDATFSNSTIKRTQNYNTTIDTNNTQVTPNKIITLYPDIVETAPAFSVNNSVNIWADYTDPLTTNGKLSLGFKSQLYWYNSTNTPVIDSGTGYTPHLDSALLAHYDYTQQIHAGYVSWNDQLGKFAYQAGLRLEDNIYNGSGSVPQDTTFHNHYLDLFPSAMVSYKLTDNESVYLTYSRRTNRPGFMQLLPFINLANPGMVSTGNPGLVPEFINNVELSYSKTDKRGDNLIFSAYYSYNQNLIETVTTPMTQAELQQYHATSSSELFSQPVNITSGTTYGLEGTGHIQIIKPWDATFSVNFFQNQLVIGNTNPEQDQYLTNNSGFTWFGKINTNIKLPWNFSYQINANYTSDQVVAEGTAKATWWMDMALRKNLWKNKATIIANCSDVFKTHQFITDYSLAQYSETVNRMKETRIGTLTFTYRFGKTDTGKKHGKGDENKLAPPTDEDRSNNLKDRNDSDNGGGQGGGGNGGQGGGSGSGGGAGGGHGTSH